ncbi:MAG: methyltransferase domain-containing protein [Candidatus Lokiarchaeia archaeon]
MSQEEIVDIVILIPKDDEFKAFISAFGIKLEKSDGELREGQLFYKFNFPTEIGDSISNFSINVVLIDDQGNEISSSITEQVLTKFDPALIFLLGTAAGREGKVKIGDVIISSLVIGAIEWRIDEEHTARPRHHTPPEKIIVDVKRYIGETFHKDEYLSILNNNLKDLYQESKILEIFLNPITKIETGVISSTDNLYVNPEYLQKVWGIDERIRCVDMESGGFGKVCKSYQRKQWLVVRGISDYGTKESKQEKFRVAAAFKAALFLKMFISNGLKETHPKWIRIPESEQVKLSSDNFYTQYDIISFLKREIKEKLNLDLTEIEINSSISFIDLLFICKGRDKKGSDHYKVISKIREKYFTEKYLNYTYENDLRGIILHWSIEVFSIINFLSIDLRSSVILEVGVGNGLEIPFLFKEVKEVIAVDISYAMLEVVKKKNSYVNIVHNPAEKLDDIDTNSIDLYISLRTYQSSLFDISQSLREMQRVLKPKGAVILSIANGFVNEIKGKKKIIRGLLVPGSAGLVDKDVPLKIAKNIIKKLNQMGFEHTGIKSEKTDVYIWGQKP